MVKAPEMGSVVAGLVPVPAVSRHEALKVDDQVIEVDWPLVMVDGVALMLAVGGDGTTTVMVEVCDAGVVPAAPTQVRV